VSSQELPIVCVSQVARQETPSAPSVTALSFGLGDWKVLRMTPWIKYVEESKKFLTLDLLVPVTTMLEDREEEETAKVAEAVRLPRIPRSRHSRTMSSSLMLGTKMMRAGAIGTITSGRNA